MANLAQIAKNRQRAGDIQEQSGRLKSNFHNNVTSWIQAPKLPECFLNDY